jgi:hypothetical protein
MCYSPTVSTELRSPLQYPCQTSRSVYGGVYSLAGIQNTFRGLSSAGDDKGHFGQGMGESDVLQRSAMDSTGPDDNNKFEQRNGTRTGRKFRLSIFEDAVLGNQGGDANRRIYSRE